ncbi:glutathione S-transferase A-like isoform X4 [Narcine bancroftii]|uniref:glutathione S-transferase A-like isoform X4 n=1 Tax=Narcine bancroftii TaxID=1343680 RepID=UPI003830FD62
MAESMVLYWGSGSPPCWRVMIVLEEKQLQGYTQHRLSFENGKHKTPEVMKLNPRGQLPTFCHGDIILNESFGVCLYLENQFNSQGTRLFPDSREEQGLTYQRMFEVLTLQEKIDAIVYYFWKVPENERCDSALERNKKALNVELKLWEGYFEKVIATKLSRGSVASRFPHCREELYNGGCDAFSTVGLCCSVWAITG